MFYLRVFACIIWFLITAFVSTLYGLVRFRHPSGAYFFASKFVPVAARLMGVTVQISNRDRIDNSRPCVILGNHQNDMDIIIHGHCCRPYTVAVGKKELIWVPVFNLIFFLTGNIFLDRANREKAITSLKKAAEYVRRKQVNVYFFPEGTRNYDSPTLLPFKKGPFRLALEARVPIVPVVCAPISPVVDLKNKRINPGVIRLDVLEPISTDDYSESQIDELIQRVHDRMQEAYTRLALAVSANC